MEKLYAFIEVEKHLEFESFSNADALNLGLFVVEIAKRDYDKGVAIHIERNRQVVFTYLMEGTTVENIMWLTRKKKIVELYDHSSMYIGEKFAEQGSTVNEVVDLPTAEYRAVGGSFPIFIKGHCVIGSLSVSGMAASDDHDLCVKALTALLDSKRSKRQ